MYRRITASCIILSMLFSGYKNENLEQTGLLRKSITLLSGVNKAWNLARIEWSIFNNDSYIAVFYGDQPEYLRQQSKRLKLNITSGDLQIIDLRSEDSGTYTVHVRNTEGQDWTNKVNLSVKEGLPEPKIAVINSTVQHGMCNIFLACSVKSESTVNIICGPEGFPHGCEFKHIRNFTMGREVEAWCSPIQDVNITCTAKDNVSTSTSTVTTGCSGHGPAPTECPPSSDPTNPGVIIIKTIITTTIIIIIITIIPCFILMYIKRDAPSEFARTPWKILTGWLPFLAQRSDNEDDSNYLNTVTFEEAPGQVSTDPESHPLQTCDVVTIIDNNMALHEEESSKKKENCDDTKPKETAEEQCGQVLTEPEPAGSEQFVHGDTPLSGKPEGMNGNL